MGEGDRSRGVIYSGTGDFYVAEAIRSARSSLAHNPVPHVLFADREQQVPDGLSITRFEPTGNPYADKIANMGRSPFERTLYLDTDTFVAGELVHVLDLLEHYDLAVAYAPAYRGLDDPGVPRAFFEFNTGVLAWRAGERTAAFIASWEQTYRAWLEDEPFPGAGKASRSRRADQPAFRRCAWEHGLSVFVLAPEYNFRLGYPTTVVEQVRVIHGDNPDPAALAARVNATHRARSWPPPLPLRAKIARRLRRAEPAPSTPRTAARERGSAGEGA